MRRDARVNDTLLQEVGSRVERAMWRENKKRDWSTGTLADLFAGRWAAGVQQQRYGKVEQMKEEAALRSKYHNVHDVDCPCPACDLAWKRLLMDVLNHPQKAPLDRGQVAAAMTGDEG